MPGAAERHDCGETQSLALRFWQRIVGFAVTMGMALQILNAREPDSEPASTAVRRHGTVIVNSVTGEIDGTLEIAVKGRAFDEQWKPVANAKIFLLGTGGRLDADTILGQTKTDKRGLYEFADVDITARLRRKPHEEFHELAALTVVGVADDRALAWHSWRGISLTGFGFSLDRNYFMPDGDCDPLIMNLRFAKDHPVTGRLLDDEGLPLRGADVELVSLARLGTLPRSIQRLLNGNADWDVDHALSLHPEFRVTSTVETDSDGRFRLAGISEYSLVGLQVRHPEFGTSLLQVAATSHRGAKHPKTGARLLGDDFTRQLARGHRATIRVTSTHPGQTRQGRNVVMTQTSGSAECMATGITNADGCLTVVLAPGSYRCSVEPDSNDPQTCEMPTRALFEIEADGDPQVIDIALRVGARIHGVLIDSQSGEPQPGIKIIGKRLDRWIFRDPDPEGVAIQVQAVTNLEGRFELLMEAGPVQWFYETTDDEGTLLIPFQKTDLAPGEDARLSFEIDTASNP